MWGNFETEKGSSLKSPKPPQANVSGVKPALYGKLPSGCRAISDTGLQVIFSPNVRVGLQTDGVWSLAQNKSYQRADGGCSRGVNGRP